MCKCVCVICVQKHSHENGCALMCAGVSTKAMRPSMCVLRCNWVLQGVSPSNTGRVHDFLLLEEG